eukprot:TRINITY_DN5649_c0_g1_i1.p1 TRINITY_DN5649_c0_g1~~TRINITY_DN5649_c0_g1_i1.p1  ORF type:complete len:395 (+),score=95.81 TRINITY_DN5649_c0_g1_i1:276-1460(+)
MAPQITKSEQIMDQIYISPSEIWVKMLEEVEDMSSGGAGGGSDEMDGLCGSILGEFFLRSINSWTSLEEALAFVLSGKLQAVGTAGSADSWRRLLLSIWQESECVVDGFHILDLAAYDLSVIQERDPACPGFAHAMLFFKGFQGLQLHRISHVLWMRGQRTMAYLLQSAISQIFSMDLHPAACVGRGVMIDHATGIVIGETAVVGSGCTLLHGVTLGGTGKQRGDRHPKLGSNVLVGAGASILGNVRIGDGAKIGAAALVLKDIPPHATAVGSPAKVIGRAKEENPANNMDAACELVNCWSMKKKVYDHWQCPFRHLSMAVHENGFLTMPDFLSELGNLEINLTESEALGLFFTMDSNNDGMVSKEEFEQNCSKLQEMIDKLWSTTSIAAAPVA